MKIKINNIEQEMTEGEVSKMYEHVLEDASEMQSFIRFLREYTYVARIAGEAVRGALTNRLHECLRMYCHFKPLSEVRDILDKEMRTFKAEAFRHHEFMKAQYGSVAQVIE